MKRWMFVAALSALGGAAQAQSVAASAAGGSENMEWTIGEVVVESVLRTGEGWITQGFNQPFSTSATAILSVDADKNEWKISPNPVRDQLRLTLSQAGTFEWQLYDLLGRPIGNGSANGAALIDFSTRAQGEYILAISRNGQTILSAVVIKN